MKNILVFMDCHGHQIIKNLKNNGRFIQDFKIDQILLNHYVVEMFPYYKNTKLEDNDITLLREADVLILQVIESGARGRDFLNNCNVIKYCKNDCLIIKIPHYRNSIYGYKTLENKNDKGELIKNWDLPNKIENIDDIDGTKQIIQNEIDKMNTFPHDREEMLKNMNFKISEFAKIANLSDVKMLDYYNNNYKKHRLFIGRGYPSSAFFFELTNRLLNLLNYKSNSEFVDYYIFQNTSEPIPEYWYKFCKFSFDNTYYTFKNIEITQCEWYYILLLSRNVNIESADENLKYLKKIRGSTF